MGCGVSDSKFVSVSKVVVGAKVGKRTGMVVVEVVRGGSKVAVDVIVIVEKGGALFDERVGTVAVKLEDVARKCIA